MVKDKFLIFDYFSIIYTGVNPHNLEPIIEAVDKSVIDHMNAELLWEFRAEEVVKALHQMYPTKAPGPDCMLAFLISIEHISML